MNLPFDHANIGSGPAQRPDLVRNPNLKSGRTPARWFDTDAFALPAPFAFGNAGRNVVEAPGLASVDLAVKKLWSLGESQSLEFRWETFNLFNRTNFDVPGRIAFTPNFGRIFSAHDPRQMQFGLRLAF